MDTSRYADLFLTESREHLSAINHSLLELERTEGGADAVSALFRAVHTVKGMSATMGYAPVAELAHELETMLDRVRKGELAVTQALMDVLFKAADALEQSIEMSVTGHAEEVSVGPIVARIRALVLGEETAQRRPSEMRRRALDGTGKHVLIRLAEGTPLRGVRAFIIVQKARSLGEVTALEPPIESIQSEEFDREFAMRLETTASNEEIDRTLRAAGDIEYLEIDGTSTDATQPTSAAPAPAIGLPATAVAAQAPAENVPMRQQRHVRIDLRRLDTLMNLIGELVITRGRLTQITGGYDDPALEETVGQASRLISDLQDEIMVSRMVPVWQVFDRFPRLVRDAARSLNKEIAFTVQGKEIELDRSMLDEIGDPIVHLLRNAIDHGIEMPDDRAAAGKPRAGQLMLSAMRDRSAVLIKVTDDGRGIDRNRVMRRAKDLGLVDAQKTEISDDELLRLISRPGFSTAEKVTDISGRGVGIDAVQNRVRALGGSVEIRSTPGQGTSVTVRLPLTLAILRALLARVGDETYALPMTHVNETVELDASRLRTVKGREVLMLRDDVLPLLRLREMVGLPRGEAAVGQAVVVELGERRAGLVVDELTGQQEIVVKQFDAVRDGLALFSGATILGDGAPALILDVSSLL